MSTTEVQADQWRDLGEEFRRLAKEEHAIWDQGQGKFAVLCAYWNCGEPTSLSLEKEKNRRQALKKDAWNAVELYRKDARVIREEQTNLGFFCFFRSPQAKESLHEQFWTLSARAGRLLKGGERIDAAYSWAFALFKEFQKERNPLAHVADDRKSGFLPRLCEASDVFCSRLERRALKLRESGKSKPFGHSPDFRSVRIRGKAYTLTAQQAAFIKILHEDYTNGHSEVSIASILERLEKRSSRWQDTFKSNTIARKALIRGGKRKGTLRINL